MTEPKPTYAVPVADHRLGPYLSVLSCKECRAPLATVTEFNGRTILVLYTGEGKPAMAYRARLRCPCGEVRLFYSTPMSAIRLGIVDE